MIPGTGAGHPLLAGPARDFSRGAEGSGTVKRTKDQRRKAPEASRPPRSKAQAARVGNRTASGNAAQGRGQAAEEPWRRRRALGFSGWFFAQWDADTDAGEPTPKKAAEVQARVTRTKVRTGYDVDLADPESAESPARRRRLLDLVGDSQALLGKLHAKFAELQSLQTMDLSVRVALHKERAGDRRQARPYWDPLAEIDGELRWIKTALPVRSGRPRNRAINEWTEGFRRRGLGAGLTAVALKTLGIEGKGDALCHDAAHSRDRVSKRRKRLK